ncbi:DctP family TRAP transporter solute-binding subunit [Pontibacillus yanchengensis]|uniref:DctP family TRAP transporter solute-binding subunit n=2 Tax=Pontibacillus yanchengensis TaxID=462910 RepID=A0ACC7VH09_9BACI|nr:DctP family TRAP transporter solute-binding subunit [Pontibacillus yanchengensis]MYL33869.1 DctP family TRAP transporter solute-binding subunit [Pontibacillus yanchengensis]MYL53895.1 DctP family TRAP transporter solute-binding subunit [Pontibacillus yanchengensis]
MKSALVKMLVACSVLVLAACSGGSDEANGDSGTTIKLAHSASESHQYHIASKKFKELVDKKTDGSVQIEIHPNATMGSESEAIEQVIGGTLDMTTVSADSSFANTVEEMNVFGIPYLFENKDHVYSVLDGEIGQDLLETANEKGMKALGYWEVGFRHVSNSKQEIKKPADMEGLKIRVQPSPVWEAHMKALGANPTPVDFNELYSALDQGVVDGQENPLPTINSMKFYEVQDYVSLTSHTYSPAITIMSEETWDKLNEDQQKAVQEAVQETKTYVRKTLDEKEQEIKDKLKEEGVTITEPDREAFKEATKNVKDAVSDKVPSELIQRIKDAAE